MRRRHSAEFKLMVVRQIESGEKRLAQVCREHALDAGMVQEWCLRVEKYGAHAFPRSLTDQEVVALGGSSSASERPGSERGQLAAAEARIGELERLVGQLTLENEFLKKALKRAGCLAPRGSRS